MGISYYPELLYGFNIGNFIMCDYASSSPYNLSHWPRGHVFGVGLSFKDYKLGKIPRAVKRFGEVIKKYFDIECDFHMV